jgi:uncharacterized protein (TIGR02001 family)
MIKKTALVLAALVSGVSAHATEAAPAAEASSLSVTVDVTYVSDYVFRGAKAASDSIQPSVEAAYGDFYAGVWYSDDVGASAAVSSETDVYAGYGFDVTDIISMDVGVTRYLYDGKSGIDTTEVFVGAAADVLLSPSFYVYYDFDRETFTYEASVGYSIAIDAIKSSLDLSAKAGYVDTSDKLKAALAEDNYIYYVVGASIPYSLSETATLTVGVDYIYNNEDTVAVFGGGGDNGQVVGKVGVSIGF